MPRPKPSWMLLALLPAVVLLTSCASTSSALPPVPIEVATIPPLPQEARQQPAPVWCLPTCTEALTTRRTNSLKRLTAPAAPASSVSGSTTR